MTKEELLEVYKDTPDRVESPIKMSEANSIISIYNGNYELRIKDLIIPINGKIEFHWFANTGACFEGNPIIELKDLYNFNKEDAALMVYINGLKFGEGFITYTTLGDTKTNSFIKGCISGFAIKGDKSISVEKIIFSIPNLRDFHGDMFKVVTDKKISSHKGRVNLDNDDFIITLDKSHLYKELRESLGEKGGYLILYDGAIKGKKKPLTYEDSREVLHCLDTFLSFLNGRRISALFLSGVYEDEVKWCDFTDYFVDTFKTVPTWPQRHSIKGIDEIWFQFSSLWKDKDNKDFLISLIHWYVEANGHSGFTEGSLIMAQTALELIYNWWIVEDKTMIVGKDSESISASNKIRLLLSQVGVNYKIPYLFTELKKFSIDNPEIIDAPEAIVQIRNAIVHSQREKRKKLSNIHNQARYEALQVCIWYIELSLLRILDFKGIYKNRCAKARFEKKTEEQVPWNQ